MRWYDLDKYATQIMLTFFKRPIVQRVLLFVVAFVFISGISGSWIIATRKLLFPFYFSIYGSAGKSLLFALATFLLLTKDGILSFSVEKWQKRNLFFFGLSVASLAAFFFFANQLLAYKNFAQAPALAGAAHAGLLLSGLFITLAVFGIHFFKTLANKFWKEVVLSAILGAIFYFLFGWIFLLWPYLSKIVLVAVAYLLHFSFPNIVIVPPLTIQLPQFAVTIGEYCSGIESLFLITTLYVLIGCVERERILVKQYLLLFIPLIIGMFTLNILRVYVIILSGVWLSPEIAAKLFHTYLGMILFMSYFFIYWRMAAPIIIQTRQKTGKESV